MSWRPTVARVAYSLLCLPNLLFLIFWTEWWIALLLVGTLIMVSNSLFRAEPLTIQACLGMREVSRFYPVSIAIGASVTWVILAGYFGVFSGWTPDWNDLRADYVSTFSTMPWPVVAEVGGEPRLLVAQLGLYLVPAAISKIVANSDLDFAQIAMATFVGTCLALVIYFVTRTITSRLGKLLGAILFLTFGGFDLLGVLARQDNAWSFVVSGGHIETWDGMLQSSSTTTLIFWVPHHALASWLGVIVISTYRKTSKFVSAAMLACAVSLIWSPFASVGLFVVSTVFWIADRKLLTRPSAHEMVMFGLAILIAVPAFRYYSLVDGVKIWWFFSQSARDNAGLGYISVARQAARYVFFWLVEVGLWLALSWLLKLQLRFEHYLAACSLLVLSQVSSWGPNDFMMRTIIAPYFVVLLPVVVGSSRILAERHSGKLFSKIVVSLSALVMSVTSLVEIVENYRREPRRLQAPCLISGCDSNLVNESAISSFAESQSRLFRE